jgi:hypothetical protein
VEDIAVVNQSQRQRRLVSNADKTCLRLLLCRAAIRSVPVRLTAAA